MRSFSRTAAADDEERARVRPKLGRDTFSRVDQQMSDESVRVNQKWDYINYIQPMAYLSEVVTLRDKNYVARV